MKIGFAQEDYVHDVFISFAHDDVIVQWLEERFLRLFQHHLFNELGSTNPRIYVAKHHIAGGMHWTTELAEQHARSKTLLALLSRPYRSRPWCQIEFSMMRAREEVLRRRQALRHSLIVPVFIHDGEDSEFETLLDDIHPIDLVRPKRLVSVCMAEKGEDAQLLDRKIEEIACAVRRAIDVSPAYCSEWSTLNCQAFLDLFEKHRVPASQTIVPGRE